MMSKNKVFRILILTTALILGIQLSASAQYSTARKTVSSFYSWYLKSKEHDPKKLRRFISAGLYQKTLKMEAEERNGYFTRKPKDINLADISNHEPEAVSFNNKGDRGLCFVHVWSKSKYFARMDVVVVKENGKWRIDEVTGITDKEASEKAVEVRIEPIELKNNLITIERPGHPPAARAVRAFGEVKIAIVVDESGKLVSAVATSGHPLLRAAAERAALKSVFSPVIVDGKPTKTKGIIAYKFTDFVLYPDFPRTCCE